MKYRMIRAKAWATIADRLEDVYVWACGKAGHFVHHEDGIAFCTGCNTVLGGAFTLPPIPQQSVEELVGPWSPA